MRKEKVLDISQTLTDKPNNNKQSWLWFSPLIVQVSFAPVHYSPKTRATSSPLSSSELVEQRTSGTRCSWRKGTLSESHICKPRTIQINYFLFISGQQAIQQKANVMQDLSQDTSPNLPWCQSASRYSARVQRKDLTVWRKWGMATWKISEDPDPQWEVPWTSSKNKGSGEVRVTGGGESEKIKDQTKQGVDGHGRVFRWTEQAYPLPLQTNGLPEKIHIYETSHRRHDKHHEVKMQVLEDRQMKHFCASEGFRRKGFPSSLKKVSAGK